MDANHNGDIAMSNGMEVKEAEVSGWIYRFIQEGWLKKRWRKRWCVLRDGAMHLFENETSDKAEKGSASIDLNKYQKCVRAGKKESKKSPHTLILEVPLKPEKNKAKAASKVARELFFTDTEADMEKWLEKLNRAIAFIHTDGGTNLEHVTKSRPKPPGAQRRPPTRRHLRDVAAQSQLLPGIDDDEVEEKQEKKKKGHVPSTAIKPPPPTASKPSSQDKQPVPMPRRKLGDGAPSEVDGAVDATATNVPPPAPSKAMKPKLQKSIDLVEEQVISEDKESETDETSEIGQKIDDESAGGVSPAPSIDNESERSSTPSSMTLELNHLKSSTSTRGPTEIGSTKSLDRCDFSQNIARSAPSSFAIKRNNSTDTRTILLKTQAQLSQANHNNLPLDRKSQSMTLLDQMKDALPPPPSPPPGDSLSDIEIKSFLKRKKNQKNKKAKSRSNPKLPDSSNDEIE